MPTLQPCLVAAVDLNQRAGGVIRRAAQLARVGDMHLVVVHVVDHDTGFESDHAPFATPSQLRSAMAREARAWLVGLLHHLDLPQAELVVDSGRLAPALAELAASRRARYVVTGPLKWGALSKLAGLADDPRLRERQCVVLHSAGSKIPWGERLSNWAGQWLQGEQQRRP